MTFYLVIETDNDAFSGRRRGFELGRIIDSVAARVRAGEFDGTVRDVNGNGVGDFGELTLSQLDKMRAEFP